VLDYFVWFSYTTTFFFTFCQLPVQAKNWYKYKQLWTKSKKKKTMDKVKILKKLKLSSIPEEARDIFLNQQGTPKGGFPIYN